jgi:hypothetical protein
MLLQLFVYDFFVETILYSYRKSSVFLVCCEFLLSYLGTQKKIMMPRAIDRPA